MIKIYKIVTWAIGLILLLTVVLLIIGHSNPQYFKNINPNLGIPVGISILGFGIIEVALLQMYPSKK